MRHYQRLVLLAVCLQLFGCASTKSAWWDDGEPQGKPGQAWAQRYTAHSFTKKSDNVQRDATYKLEEWAEWKCPTGYDTQVLRVIEDPNMPPPSGLLSMYYGRGLGIRKSVSLEMEITCRSPHALAENTLQNQKQ